MNEFAPPNELLSFYQKYGGKEVFEQTTLALETLLFTIQDIENDDLSKVVTFDNIFEPIPLSDNEWFNICIKQIVLIHIVLLAQ